MPAVSPNIGLHLTDEDDSRNFIELRLELSGEDEESNMMIIDGEIGSIKQSVVYSSAEPTGQKEGNVWNKILQ